MPTNFKFSVYKTSANLQQDATFPVTVCDAICEHYSFKKYHLHLKTGYQNQTAVKKSTSLVWCKRNLVHAQQPVEILPYG